MKLEQLLCILALITCCALVGTTSAAGVGTFSIEQTKSAEVGQIGVVTLYMDNTWQPLADDVWVTVKWDGAVLGYISTDWKVGNSVSATLTGTNSLFLQMADFSNNYPNGKVAVADINFKALAAGSSPMTIAVDHVRSHDAAGNQDPSLSPFGELTASAVTNPGTFTVEKTAAPPSPKQRFTPGDIVYDRPTNQDMAWVVLGFDPRTDEYKMDIVFRYDDGHWGYRLDDEVSWLARDYIDSSMNTVITHVHPSQIAIGYPGLSSPPKIDTPTPTVPTPSPAKPVRNGPRFSPGDLVYERPTNQGMVWLILGYDGRTDEYAMDTIFRYADGNWGYRLDSEVSWFTRDYIDTYVNTLINHVDPSQVTIGYPENSSPPPSVTQPTVAPGGAQPVTVHPVAPIPTGAGSASNPPVQWGKRYAVGDPGTFLGTRYGSGTVPTKIGSNRKVAATGSTLKPGSRAYGITPPAPGHFVRWYPAARWAAGLT